MEKPYAEQLSDWIKCSKPAKRDQYLVAFLAVSDDVRAALAAGFAMNTIWRHMYASGRVPFGYDTFLKHVHRMQKATGPAEETPGQGVPPSGRHPARPARHPGNRMPWHPGRRQRRPASISTRSPTKRSYCNGPYPHDAAG